MAQPLDDFEEVLNDRLSELFSDHADLKGAILRAVSGQTYRCAWQTHPFDPANLPTTLGPAPRSLDGNRFGPGGVTYGMALGEVEACNYVLVVQAPPEPFDWRIVTEAVGRSAIIFHELFRNRTLGVMLGQMKLQRELIRRSIHKSIAQEITIARLELSALAGTHDVGRAREALSRSSDALRDLTHHKLGTQHRSLYDGLKEDLWSELSLMAGWIEPETVRKRRVVLASKMCAPFLITMWEELGGRVEVREEQYEFFW